LTAEQQAKKLQILLAGNIGVVLFLLYHFFLIATSPGNQVVIMEKSGAVLTFEFLFFGALLIFDCVYFWFMRRLLNIY
jgi:hypothetical protein